MEEGSTPPLQPRRKVQSWWWNGSYTRRMVEEAQVDPRPCRKEKSSMKAWNSTKQAQLHGQCYHASTNAFVICCPKTTNPLLSNSRIKCAGKHRTVNLPLDSLPTETPAQLLLLYSHVHTRSSIELALLKYVSDQWRNLVVQGATSSMRAIGPPCCTKYQ